MSTTSGRRAGGTRRGSGLRWLVAGVAAAVAGTVLLLDRTGRLPGGADLWARTNHAGHPVSLAQGPALALGIGMPLAVSDPPAALAVVGSAAAGAVDDHAGSGTEKGLRGHLRALRRGRITTGSMKIVLLLASGGAATAWSDARAGRSSWVGTAAGGALVAGTANLTNLFDLRPGRALKVALLAALPLALGGSVPASAVSGASLVTMPSDLARRTMMGDTGANPLGAAVGLAAAQSLSTRGRVLLLAGVAGLTLASEKVSFSRVIDDTPWLRTVDRWGRTG